MSSYEERRREYWRLRRKFWVMVLNLVAMMVLVVGAIYKYGQGEYEAAIALTVFAILAELWSPFRKENQ